MPRLQSAPTVSDTSWLNEMHHNSRLYFKQPNHRSAGFTLLEVLVALVIVGTALGASLRAVGSLTQNSSDLRASMMATWSAENQLSQIRLAHEWPALGQRRFDCAQGELHLVCEESVYATPNPFFRRVEVGVFDTQNTGRRIIKLTQVVPNAQ
jgi:general secretion pathway protein I